MVMAPPPSTATRKGIDVQAIASAHLFGEAKDEPVAAEDAKADADEPGAVRGVRRERPGQGPGGHRRVAAIREGVRASAPSYAPERSCIRSTWIASSSIATASSRRCRCRGRARQAWRSHAAAAPRPGNNGQFADNLRRIAETNPTAFAEIVRPQPVFANGVQRGYRVYPGRNRQQFASSACSRATWCCRSTARRWMTRSAAWRSSTRSARPIGQRHCRAQRPVAGADAQHGADHAAGLELAAAGPHRPAAADPDAGSSRPSRNSSQARTVKKASKDRP